MSIVFGLAEYKGAIAGVHLQTVNYSEQGSTAEAINEDGDVEQIDVYGAKRQIQAEGNVVEGSDLSALKVGAVLTVEGVEYKITDSTVRATGSGHKTISVTGVAPLTINGGTAPTAGA